MFLFYFILLKMFPIVAYTFQPDSFHWERTVETMQRQAQTNAIEH